MAGKGGNIPGSGRKKGTPNRKTVEAQHIAERLGVDPFELLLLFAKNDWKKLGYASGTVTKYIGDSVIEEPVISPELRQNSAGKAVEYLYPRRKAIEQTLTDNTVTQITRTVITKPVER